MGLFVFYCNLLTDLYDEFFVVGINFVYLYKFRLLKETSHNLRYQHKC